MADGKHALRSRILQFPPPLTLTPVLAPIGRYQRCDIKNVEVAVAPLVWHGEHETARVVCISDEPVRPPVKRKGIEDGEEPSQHNLEAANGSMNLWHDKDKAFGRRRWVRVNRDNPLELNQGGRVNERLGLWVNRKSRERITNGRNRPCLLRNLLRIVELDIALQHRRLSAVIRRLLLIEVLLQLVQLLLIRWRDHAPALSPWRTSAKAHANPVLVLECRSRQDDVDAVEGFALAGDQRAGVRLLQGRILEHGQADAGGPLHQGVVRVEVEQIPVLARCRYAEHILEGLIII